MLSIYRPLRRVLGLLSALGATFVLSGCQVPFVTDTSRMNPDVFARETAPVFYQPNYAQAAPQQAPPQSAYPARQAYPPQPAQGQPQPYPRTEPIPQRRELYQTQFHQTYGLPVSNPVNRIIYDVIRDDGHTLPAIPYSRVDANFLRQTVDYQTNEPAGTIIVDTRAHFLYLVQGGGKAVRYGVGLGKAGFAWHGRGVIARKAKWPRWTPPDDMVARQPDLRKFAAAEGGADPGLNNPLGARALYIYQNGKDTLYRVHGTPDWQSVGKATSSGCVRMFNQDVIDLFDRVPTGTPIVVM
ncbi:MAG: L,D-transpeptidase [Neorhizobium sp.]|jgi:lipoprotein-anchoring transpeptidase ErfK/SrfK|nr:L,D-transpeptidase [Neorhizobium sp.]